jgi:hypothetical protein
MEINEKIVRIIGGSSLTPETEFSLGDDAIVEITGSIVKIEEKDNQDGTKDRVYFVKQITAKVK